MSEQRDRVQRLVNRLKANGYAITPQGWLIVERIIREELRELLLAAEKVTKHIEYSPQTCCQEVVDRLAAQLKDWRGK